MKKTTERPWTVRTELTASGEGKLAHLGGDEKIYLYGGENGENRIAEILTYDFGNFGTDNGRRQSPTRETALSNAHAIVAAINGDSLEKRDLRQHLVACIAALESVRALVPRASDRKLIDEILEPAVKILQQYAPVLTMPEPQAMHG